MTANELMAHIAALELQIRDMMTILGAIAYIQEDKMFSVSITDMKVMPPGSSVDFSFNRKLDQYEFSYVPPAPEPSAGLILPLSADGEKAAELVRESTRPQTPDPAK
jgi:hypothetical protein